MPPAPASPATGFRLRLDLLGSTNPGALILEGAASACGGAEAARLVLHGR